MTLADGLDVVKERTAEVVSVAAQKFEIVKEIARTKSAVLSLEKRIKELRLELADLCYREHMSDESVEPDQYRALCEKIYKAKKKNEKLCDRLNSLKLQLSDRDSKE